MEVLGIGEMITGIIFFRLGHLGIFAAFFGMLAMLYGFL